MKNSLLTAKLNNEASPERLQENRAELFLNVGGFCNACHNGEMTPDRARQAMTAKVEQYKAYYQLLARQSRSIGLMDLASTFRETAILCSPWNFERLVADRFTFDKMFLEIDLIEAGDGEPLFNVYQAIEGDN